MRLIDADAAKKKAKDFDGGIPWTMRSILALLDACPTIAPPPNGPLTLEELREMDGEPVWVERFKRWMFVLVKMEKVVFVDSDNLCYSERMACQVYRRRPEEGTA